MSMIDKFQFVLLGSLFLALIAVTIASRWFSSEHNIYHRVSIDHLKEGHRDMQAEIVHLISVNRRLEARVQQLEARLHDDQH